MGDEYRKEWRAVQAQRIRAQQFVRDVLVGIFGQSPSEEEICRVADEVIKALPKSVRA